MNFRIFIVNLLAIRTFVKIRNFVASYRNFVGLKNIVLIGVIVAVVAGSFWFFVKMNRQEDELANELKAVLYTLSIFLEEMSDNKEYVNNRNFTVGILESGLGQTKNVNAIIHKLNDQKTRKEKLFAKLTFGLSGIKDSKYLEIEKTLAIAKNIEDEISWWIYFQKGTEEFMVYDVEADLQNRSVNEEKRDFIFRLYLAKSGLLKSLGNLKTISNLSKDKEGLFRITSQEEGLIKIIDLLIMATDKNKIGESNLLREKYLEETIKLKKNLREFSARVYTDNQFQVLEAKINSVVIDMDNYD
ncbi:MAG: hypothetical protein Q8R55_04105 [Candidatus Taylorbacteria bacterium]|nr:hypothetical protein [Candidatus Taylorbacteria bacterium]